MEAVGNAVNSAASFFSCSQVYRTGGGAIVAGAGAERSPQAPSNSAARTIADLEDPIAERLSSHVVTLGCRGGDLDAIGRGNRRRGIVGALLGRPASRETSSLCLRKTPNSRPTPLRIRSTSHMASRTALAEA